MHGGKNLYQTRINVNPAHFIDWDKPLSEHSQYVRDALARVTGIPRDYLNNEHIYGHHIEPFAKTPEDVQALRNAGIPGIKYSTRTGSSNSNYVLFDAKHADITHKNGVSVVPVRTPQFYTGLLSQLGPDWANAPIIGHTGDVVHGAVSKDRIGGRAVWMNEDGSHKVGIVAYHGTPHEFDQFDIGKIGTGEGAQVYGHGLYFAESQGVAKDYRDTLARAANATLPIFHKAEEWVSQFQSPRDAMHALNDEIAELRKGGSFRLLREYEAIRDQLTTPNLGHLYTVRINAHPEHFLDWDRLLSEQSPQVKAALGKLPISTKGQFPDFMGKPWNDPELMEGTLASYLPKTLEFNLGAEGASKALAAAGIPGIKYLDQGSRTQLQNANLAAQAADLDRQIANAKKQLSGLPASMRPDYQAHIDSLTSERAGVQRKLEPTRNYVLFGHEHIDITHRNGVSVTPVEHDPFAGR